MDAGGARGRRDAAERGSRMTMGKPKKTPVLYKLTRDGRSPHMGYEWSLPLRGEPGQWHEVEGELKPHANGFHLTSDPKRHWSGRYEVWLVETEGEAVCVREDEWCARKVRLMRRLSPTELDALNVGVSRSWRTSSRAYHGIRKRIPEGESPVVRLFRIVNDHVGTSGNKSGENLANNCLHKALDLVVEARMEFGPDDVKTIASMYDGIGTEWTYAGLVRSGNLSACKSWEKFAELTPWFWQGQRLYPRARLPWAGRECTITTFGRDKLVACSYRKVRRERDGDDREGAIEKRFTITREELAEADRRWTDGAALRDEIKATAEALKQAGARVDQILIALWSAEEREVARTWAVFEETDRGKSRVQAPEKPARVARDHAITMAGEDAWEAKRKTYFAKPHHERGDYPEREEAPEIAAATVAVQAWHAAMFVGVPADYLKGNKGAGARTKVTATARAAA